MKLRIIKVGELIKQEVGRIILEGVNFPEKVLVTVIKAKVSVDLRYADVFVSVFPSGKAVEEEVEKILNENVYDIQQELNKELSMRPVPKIRFRIDTSGQYVEKISKLIKKSGLKNK